MFWWLLGARVLCGQGGVGARAAPNQRGRVSGEPVVAVVAPHAVVGCPFAPGGVPTPCVTAQWIVGATRIFAGGAPVLLQDSQATCIPNGTPVNIIMTQVRVRGT